MKSKYFIDRNTINFLRDLYRQERANHPDCRIGFGWGGDSTGRSGVMNGMYYDTSEAMPPVYYYEDIPIYIAFPNNMPEELKSGVICFISNEFKIFPIKEFDQADLVEGLLEKSMC